MTEFEKTMAQDTMLFDQLEEKWDMEREISEYEASQQQEIAVPEEVDTRTLKLTRQRNSRRKAAAKNSNFEAKKASRKEARIEKNSDIHGHCPMKPKHVAYFKTARRRAMRRQANKLVFSEE